MPSAHELAVTALEGPTQMAANVGTRLWLAVDAVHEDLAAEEVDGHASLIRDLGDGQQRLFHVSLHFAVKCVRTHLLIGACAHICQGLLS